MYPELQGCISSCYRQGDHSIAINTSSGDFIEVDLTNEAKPTFFTFPHQIICSNISPVKDTAVALVDKFKNVYYFQGGITTKLFTSKLKVLTRIRALGNYVVTSGEGLFCEIYCHTSNDVYYIEFGGLLHAMELIQFNEVSILISTITTMQSGKLCSLLVCFNLNTMKFVETELPLNFSAANQIFAFDRQNSLRICVFSGLSYVILHHSLENNSVDVLTSSSIQNFLGYKSDGTFICVESLTVLNENENTNVILSTSFGDLLSFFVDDKDQFNFCEKQKNTPFHSLTLVCNNLIACSISSGLEFVELQRKFDQEVSLSPTSLDHLSKLNIFSSEFKVSKEIISDLYGNHFVIYGWNSKTSLGKLKQDIPVKTELKSDQIFRGAIGLWAVRQYNVDKYHTMMIVSFISSTALLKHENGDFVDRSEQYGIDTQSRTLAIENSCSGSFLIQVCPKKISICRSVASDVNQDLIAEYEKPSGYWFSAFILNDYIFVSDLEQKTLDILQFKYGRGKGCITSVSQEFFSSEIYSLAVLDYRIVESSINQKLDSDLTDCLIAISLVKNVEVRRFTAIKGLYDYQKVTCTFDRVPQDIDVVSDMMFLKEKDILRIYFGLRNGKFLAYKILENFDSTIDLTLMVDVKVGDRPVKLIRVPTSSTEVRLVTLSGSACVIDECSEGYSLCKVLEKADLLVKWISIESENSLITEFLSIAHGTLQFLGSRLKKLQRIVHLLNVPYLQFILPLPHLENTGSALNESLVLVSSFKEMPKHDYKVSPMSSIPPEVSIYSILDGSIYFPTVLAQGDVISCALLLDSSHIVIGLQTHGVGQLRILCIPPLAQRKKTNIRQPASSFSPPSFKHQNQQLIFTCDSGFPHPVDSLCLLKLSLSNSEEKDCSFVVVAAGREIHLVKVDEKRETLEIIRTSAWKSETKILSHNGNGIVAAITKTGYIEILRYDEKNGWTLMWTSTYMHLIDKVHWQSTEILAFTDRRGCIHVIDIREFRIVSFPMNSDIPLGISSGDNSQTLLVPSISGIIHTVPLNNMEIM